MVNAAAEAEEQGEGLRDFLDHAALVADTDDYSAAEQVTLMTMHAAKGLEFPLVFIAGWKKTSFRIRGRGRIKPNWKKSGGCVTSPSRRAEKYLYITHAMKRRVYGEELPAEPSRFPDGISARTDRRPLARPKLAPFCQQDFHRRNREAPRTFTPTPVAQPKRTSNYQGRAYNDADSVREFFAKQGKKIDDSALDSRPSKSEERKSTGGGSGLQPGTRVKHAKYGQGLIVSVRVMRKC